MVALVRGVHGLNGAVRAEVLTDRPEDRFVAGAVLYREGDDRPLTIASAEAVADGPAGGSASARSPRATPPTRCAAPISRSVVRPDEDLGPRRVLLARGHRRAGPRRRRRPSSARSRDIYRVGETEVYVVDGGPFGEFDVPAVRAFIRIFAPRRGEIVVDAESLDLRPPRSRDARSGSAARRPGAGADAAPRHRPPNRRPAGDALPSAGPGGRGARPGGRGARGMTLEIDVLTLFPAMIDGPLAESIPGRIQEQGLADIRIHDLREWGLGRHRSVDDPRTAGERG